MQEERTRQGEKMAKKMKKLDMANEKKFSLLRKDIKKGIAMIMEELRKLKKNQPDSNSQVDHGVHGKVQEESKEQNDDKDVDSSNDDDEIWKYFDDEANET